MKSASHHLPKDFIERLHSYYPRHAAIILNSYTHPRRTTFRLNALKTDRQQLLRDLKREHVLYEQVAWNPEAFILKNSTLRELQKKEIYLNGHIYVQNLSSMVPPLILDPHEDEKILDLCAAPGSKTTQMASAVMNKAEIVAVEKIKPRFYRLRANCGLLGAKVKLICGDGIRIAREYPDYFDKVLLDAPCSSEGLFDIHRPKSFAYWSRRKVSEMRHKQKRLIIAAWNALKAGGTLVYSTCTFSPQENEDVLHFLIRKVGDAADFKTLALPFKNSINGITQIDDRPLDQRVTKGCHILPTSDMEGFFIAKIVKGT
jgi:16S rRNA (cytosine1407-C5)-methyltransferase